MPLFFLDVCNGTGYTKDTEGAELADENEARQKAIAGARDIMVGDIRGGMLDLTSYIEVLDAERRPLFRLSFADAVTITHKH
jgi:hypothetical protein